jgi:hypothetical protein
MAIPGWIAALPETEPPGVAIATLEIVVLPFVVFPVIRMTGIIKPRSSVNLPPELVI